MDEITRHRLYILVAIAIAALIGIDIAQGGDAQQWVMWIAGVAGIGGASLAAKNTTSTREDDNPPQ